MLEIGISTNNESGSSDFEILNNIANAGFKNVMLSFKAKNIEETIKTIYDLGMNISCFHIDNKYANDLWATGEAVERYIQDIINQLEICGKYNIPIAVMHATWGSPTDFALNPNEQGLENFERILKVAKKNNVKIAIENVDYYSIKHVYYLLDNIKDKSVGFCYDVGHHHLYNPKTDLIKKYGDRLFAVHLHDNLMDWHKGYDYTRDLHLLPFDGKINFHKVCKKLKGVGYNGIVMLELHKKACGKPQMYEDVENLEYLKRAFIKAKMLVDLIKEANWFAYFFTSFKRENPYILFFIWFLFFFRIYIFNCNLFKVFYFAR